MGLLLLVLLVRLVLVLVILLLCQSVTKCGLVQSPAKPWVSRSIRLLIDVWFRSHAHLGGGEGTGKEGRRRLPVGRLNSSCRSASPGIRKEKKNPTSVSAHGSCIRVKERRRPFPNFRAWTLQ